jgi:hypothetical protein
MTLPQSPQHLPRPSVVLVTWGLQRPRITGQHQLHFQMPHTPQQGIDHNLLVVSLNNQPIDQNAQIVAAKVGRIPSSKAAAQLRF